MLAPADLIALARTIASKRALDLALICAIVEQESAWDTHAIRYEPAFRARYVAPLGLPPTEEVARSISWGLMQVMGQVAREHGFSGKFLSALCDPAIGLDIGCAVLASKIAAASQRASTSAGPVEGQGFSPANSGRREAPSFCRLPRGTKGRPSRRPQCHSDLPRSLRSKSLLALSNYGTAAPMPTTHRKSSRASPTTNDRPDQRGTADPMRNPG